MAHIIFSRRDFSRNQCSSPSHKMWSSLAYI